MSERREAEIHHLIAGDLCLDFANTLNGHERPAGHEYLHDYRDLLLWARHASVLSAGDYKELLREAEARPDAAQAAFRNALNLREAIFRVFSALAFERKPAAEDLEQLNRAWQDGQRHARLMPAAKGFRLGWDDDPSLERLARQIAVAAIHLLTSGQIKRIHRCAGEGCDWLFVDTSRNHLRRWCSMEECGNRAKMRRRQQRKKLSFSK